MGRPIHKLTQSALRILIAWLLALQPMVGAYAAAAAANSPLSMELCRGVPAPDDGAPAQPGHSAECCLACAPTPAPPPEFSVQLPVPPVFVEAAAPRIQSISVARAGLGPQSARAPPL